MESEFLTVEDVARIARVTVRTVNRWCRDGRLKAARVGRRWLIKRAALAELLDSPLLPEGDSDAKKADRLAVVTC